MSESRILDQIPIRFQILYSRLSAEKQSVRKMCSFAYNCEIATLHLSVFLIHCFLAMRYQLSMDVSCVQIVLAQGYPSTAYKSIICVQSIFSHRKCL